MIVARSIFAFVLFFFFFSFFARLVTRYFQLILRFLASVLFLHRSAISHVHTEGIIRNFTCIHARTCIHICVSRPVSVMCILYSFLTICSYSSHNYNLYPLVFRHVYSLRRYIVFYYYLITAGSLLSVYSGCALLFVLTGGDLSQNIINFPLFLRLSLSLFSLSHSLATSLLLSQPSFYPFLSTLPTRYRAQTQRCNAIQDANPILQPPAGCYLWVLVQRAWKHNGRIVVG